MNIHPVSNRQDTHDAYTEKQTVEPEPMHESAQLTTTMPLPISVYNINYDICRVRKLLEEEAPKGKRASFMNMMKERKADKDLANTYRAREIVSRI